MDTNNYYTMPIGKYNISIRFESLPTDLQNSIIEILRQQNSLWSPNLELSKLPKVSPPLKHPSSSISYTGSGDIEKSAEFQVY